MAQLNRHASFLLIEDQLDAIGQKYRLMRIVRGLALWAVAAVGVSLLAAITAHWVGPSNWNWLVASLWGSWLAVTAFAWIVRPLAMRVRPVEVARLVEQRVDGLHNGFTNSVLLGRADDLHDSPWLGAIFDEILAGTRGKPLDQAVRLSDLRPLFLRLGLILIPALVVAAVMPSMFAHGWRQMFKPEAFIAQLGEMEILQVQPGDVTLISGQALGISILARGPKMPEAKLVFEGDSLPSVELSPTVAREDEVAAILAAAPPEPAGVNVNLLRYIYRAEHVEKPFRYRIEVGRTQTPWYAVTLVKQVKLAGLTLAITPPAYLRQEPRILTLNPQDLNATPVTVPQGSRVDLSATIDVPVNGAMLQVGDTPPTPMDAAVGGTLFTGSTTVYDDAAVAVLLTEGAGQIIARLPDPSLAIHCAKDAPPTIEMKWPTQDTAVAPSAEVKVSALLKDDAGLTSARILMAGGGDQLLTPLAEQKFTPGTLATELSQVIAIKPELRKHGQSIRVQVEVTDNRDIPVPKGESTDKALSRQTAASSIYEIRFRDPEQIAMQDKLRTDKLRQRLMELLKKQQDLHTRTVAWKPADKTGIAPIHGGQIELRTILQNTAETFEFDTETRVVQKTLLVLAHNPAKDAVDLGASIAVELVDAQRAKLGEELTGRQRRIISTLESLLALLNASPPPTTQAMSREGGDIPNKKEAFEKLNEALKEFMKEQQRVMDQSAPLVKKPVDDFSDADKKLLEDLKQAQEKLDAFMQEKVADFSKLAEQDMANASMLKELMEVYSEVTMAKDALKDKAVEIAVSLEESGLENAKEISSNLEKWLMDTPDRQKWTMEDPLTKTDTPMAELPAELEDMVGELMEQQEDLFEEMEDTNANWTDSLDKGAGWDAMDGPIANMSAKGVTGNQLPNNNEMGGRSGEGRSGKSQGEFVEETASGKGGRNTPTRLDPTPFQQGQVKDESTDPVGGATGGGKLSGQGGAGLEGPVPPKIKEEMQRLAQKQAELRNSAERLNLQYQLGRYDNFKMLESIALMRRVESDFKSNRYQTAMRRKDLLLDRMETSHLLLSGRIHVEHDTTPAGSTKVKEEINDAMKGQLPAAWEDALKEYYRKLSTE